MSLQRASLRIAVLAVLLLGAACATTQKDIPGRYSADELRGMGEKFLAADDFTQALKFFRWAEAKKPNDPHIHYDLGITHDELSMSTEALHHLNRAIELSPQYSDAYNALGRHYARAGNLDMAQINFEKALANPLYETPHLALFNLGLLYEKRGDPDTALHYYEAAVQKFPRYGLAYYRMGEILEAQHRGDEARLAYGKATEYAANMPEAHLRFGIMSYMVGELENAFYSLDRVTKLAPNTTMAEEARLYLSQMNSIVDPIAGERRSPVSAAKPMPTIVVAKERDLEKSVSAPAAQSAPRETPPPKVSEPQVREPERIQEVQEVLTPPPVPEATAPVMEEKPEKAEEEPSPAPEQSPQVQKSSWSYIVQVGSYLHRRNADILKKKLQDKGYESTVKVFKHKVLGDLHVVQLKPVSDQSRALSLVSQIEKDGLGKAIVIKVAPN